MKKVLSILIILFSFLGVFETTVNSKTEYSFNVLKNCKNIYTSSNEKGAFVYGFKDNKLYANSIFPEINNIHTTVDGVIRAVCQDNNLTYALCEGYELRENYFIITYDLLSDKTKKYNLNFITGFDDKCFSVCDGKLYFRKIDTIYPYVESYSIKGELIKKYTFDKAVKDIFNNGSFVYALLQDGQIFKLTQNGSKYINEVSSNSSLSNAGIDYVFSSDNNLISLVSGKSEFISNTSPCCVVWNKNGVVYSKDNKVYLKNDISTKTYNVDKRIKAVLSYNDSIAIIKDDYSFEIIKISDFEEYTLPNINNDANSSINSNLNVFVNSYDIVTGIKSGTNVSDFRKSFNHFVKVYNHNGDEISTGKIKTGYKTDCFGDLKIIAVLGDITGEGNVKSNDVNAFMKHLSGEELLKDSNLTACDYNVDSYIDNRDLVLISRKSKE